MWCSHHIQTRGFDPNRGHGVTVNCCPFHVAKHVMGTYWVVIQVINIICLGNIDDWYLKIESLIVFSLVKTQSPTSASQLMWFWEFAIGSVENFSTT